MEERDAATPENRERDIEMLKETASDVAETFTPYGDYLTGKEAVEDFKRGDYGSAALGAAATAVGLVPGIGDVVAKGFKKTRKAYKLFVKGEDGELYPLFVNADIPVKQGEFLAADFPDVAFKGKRKEGSKEIFYVPTKGAKRSSTKYYLDDIEITKKEYDSLGPNAKEFAKVVKGEKSKNTGDPIIIPDEETRQNLIEKGFITNRTKRTKEAPFGKVTAVAARPGHHASQSPVATHLGPQDLKVNKTEVKKLLAAGITPEAIKKRGDQFYVKRRAEDHVYAEVEMADDVDYQSMLAKEGKSDINDYIPRGGSYRYSDGQADSDQWIVGGDMKVNRVLSREETKKLQKEMGVVDLPYRDEVESILGRKFLKGGVVMDDYIVGKMVDEEPLQKFAEGGAVMPMREQMSMFEEGGLNHQGGTKDPVSGNDVPIGSTQKEVRDDIPAMLSEGEYVIPADVVRFYGIKFFEELRMGAKEGMQLLDAKGQMGNGDEQVVPDDVPFDLEDLMIDAEQDDVINAQKGTFVPASTYSLPSNVQQYAYYTAPTVPQYGTPPVYAQPVYTAPSQVETPQPYLSYEQLVGSSQMPTKTEETTEEDTTSEDTADETKVETARVVEAQDSEGTPSASDVADAEQFDRDSLMSSTVAGIEGLSLDSKGKLEFDSKFDLGPIGTLAGFVSGPIGTIGSLASAIGDKGPQASGVTALGQTLSELGYNRSELDAIGGSLIGAAGIFSKGVDSDYGKAVEKGLAAYAKTNNLTIEQAYAQVSKLALQRAEKLFGDPTGGTGGGYGVYGGTSGYMDPDTGVVSAFGPKGSFAALMEKDLSKAIEVAKNQDFLSKMIYDLEKVVQPKVEALGGRAPEAAQPAEGIGYGSGALGMTQEEAAEEEAAMAGDGPDSPGSEADGPGTDADTGGAIGAKGGLFTKKSLRRNKNQNKRKGLAARK